MGKELDAFSKKVTLVDGANYSREAYQSYMTSPEWLSVDLSEDFSMLLKDNTSMFQFSYFYSIYQLWRVFVLALGVSIRESGFFNTVFSDYMVMDLFVVVFTSFELLPKGLLALLLWPFLPKQNDTDFQHYVADYFYGFVKEIEKTPFFNHDYDAAIQSLKDEWNQPESVRTWVDWFTYQTILMELRFKGFTASFLKNSDENESHTTQVLVKFSILDCESDEEAIDVFKDRLEQVDEDIRPTLVTFHDQEEVYVKPQQTKRHETYHNVYARLAMPRYMMFKEAVLALADHDIYLKEIAGNRHVMLKCETNSISAEEKVWRDTKVSGDDEFDGRITPLYRYERGVRPGSFMCFFNVAVEELEESILDLSDGDDLSVKFVHNF